MPAEAPCDMRTDMSRADVASVKADMSLMKWMLGFVLAFQIAFAFKLFAH
jgi:hypothetical protein